MTIIRSLISKDRKYEIVRSSKREDRTYWFLRKFVFFKNFANIEINSSRFSNNTFIFEFFYFTIIATSLSLLDLESRRSLYHRFPDWNIELKLSIGPVVYFDYSMVYFRLGFANKNLFSTHCKTFRKT